MGKNLGQIAKVNVKFKYFQILEVFLKNFEIFLDNSSNHIFIAFFGNFSQIFFCVLMSVNFWYNTYNLKRQINPNYLFAQPMSNEYGDHVTRLDQWGLEESINRNDPKSCNKLRPIESQESGSNWVRHKKKLLFFSPWCRMGKS